MSQPTTQPLVEAHLREVERVMLYVSEARERAAKAHATLAREEAEPHLLSTLRMTEEAMRIEHKRLMQSTFFAVPEAEDPVDEQQHLAM